MTLINKFSTSSYNTFDDCQMKWFLSYVLGYFEPSGKAAVKGTVCHSVMEAVGWSKILRQKGQKTKKDEVFGTLKQTYKIPNLIKKAYDYHLEQESHLEWNNKDYADVINWTNLAVEHEYFPENHNEIISVEEKFRIPINEPWALLPDGNRLHITGIVDLIFRDKDGRLNYLDYKFGREPKNWNTGDLYTYETMRNNIQLGLYYWAILNLYKKDNPRTHIWYPRSDDLWSYNFDENESNGAMIKIKKAIEKVLTMKVPERNKSWKCTKFCQFGKKTFEELGIKDRKIKPNGTEWFPCSNEDDVVACDAVTRFLSKRDIGIVIEKCGK